MSSEVRTREVVYSRWTRAIRSGVRRPACSWSGHRLARLDEVVELVGGPARELVDDRPAARRPEQVRPVEHPRQRVHEVDVRLEALADAGPLDLDRDRSPVGQDRAMDLADRCRRERLAARTTRKTTSGGAAQLLADDLAHLGVRERRDLVEQLEQLVAVGGRQQVEAHGQHLAELDPGAAELARARGARGPVDPASGHAGTGVAGRTRVASRRPR